MPLQKMLQNNPSFQQAIKTFHTKLIVFRNSVERTFGMKKSSDQRKIPTEQKIAKSYHQYIAAMTLFKLAVIGNSAESSFLSSTLDSVTRCDIP